MLLNRAQRYLPAAAALLAALALGAPAAAGMASGACRQGSCPARRVLRGDGIAHAVFGETPAVVQRRIDKLLGRRPSEGYHASKRGGGVDHEIRWPLLRAFFGRGRFIGYEYGGRAHAVEEPVLATRKGLRVGDTVARGMCLYGQAFSLSAEQGGAWFASTPRGRLFGYTSKVTNPKGKIRTIEAGRVGGPALTP